MYVCCICAAVFLRKAKPHVTSVVSNLLLEASAPRAVCSGSAKHLRLSDKGGGVGGRGGGGVGTASEGDKFLLRPGQGQDAQRAVVCESERAQALSIVEV